MSEIFSKLSKAVDAFTDVLTEDIDSKKNLAIYKYDDFIRLFKESKRENPIIGKATISVKKVTEFDGAVFPETKFLIRIVFLDKDNHPILINGNKDEMMGNITIANSIDAKLAEFMGEKSEKTVIWKGEK